MPEWVLQLAGLVFGAGATYGAIRGDLKALHEKAGAAVAAAESAHRRLDALMMKGGWE